MLKKDSFIFETTQIFVFLWSFFVFFFYRGIHLLRRQVTGIHLEILLLFLTQPADLRTQDNWRAPTDQNPIQPICDCVGKKQNNKKGSNLLFIQSLSSLEQDWKEMGAKVLRKLSQKKQTKYSIERSHLIFTKFRAAICLFNELHEMKIIFWRRGSL